MKENQLNSTDLCVDAIYGGSRNGNASDDPLPKLLGVDNGAGFRHLGKRPNVATLNLLALKTSLSDVNWPDSMDREAGTFTYFGDNRKPGDLHQTPRKGNLILRNLFDEAHTCNNSEKFPPIFVFANTGVYRDVRFLGLAVPGALGKSADDDLVAVWRCTDDGVRFQNYRAIFTILDVPVVKREWINEIKNGNIMNSPYAPEKWLKWVRTRKISPLLAAPAKNKRSKLQQLPSTEGSAYIDMLRSRYHDSPHGFEKCAMEIARLFMPNIISYEITRPWRDGGRDAVGQYRLGQGAGGIDVQFALEAKCYGPQNGVGVRALSRLISRLRHRQFGILVTTSYLDSQAYDELINDDHPVCIISANDIADKLREKFGSVQGAINWINQF